MFIFRFFYNIALIILLPVIVPAGYLYAMKRNDEKDYFERFGFLIFPPAPKQSIWFHCASVGETRSIKGIVEKIKKDCPELSIIVSTNTVTGKDVAKKELEPYFTFLLPFENPMAYRFIMSGLRVKALFIVDTEMWPNLIYTVSKYVKVFLINARISDGSFKNYKKFRFILKDMLKKYTKIYAKSDEDMQKFVTLKGDSENIENFGNMKFYEKSVIPEIEDVNFLKKYKIFTAASTHKGEEEAAIKAFINAIDRFDKIVIAPRHNFRIEDAVEECKKHGLTYSMLSEYNEDTQAVIVDSFGKLEALYAMSEKIFIGGSIANIGGHNIFEALQFNKKLCVGPNMHNFAEIFSLATKHSLATVVSTPDDIAGFLKTDDTDKGFSEFFAEIEQEASRKKDTLLKVIDGLLLP